jgi:hypothetical protein
LVAPVVLLASLIAPAALAEDASELRARYTKYEHEILMRDGVKLYTAVYVPKDATRRYPILLTRTPYSLRPYGVDNYPDQLGPSAAFVKAGYIFVLQDVRGRYMSGGEFTNMRPLLARSQGKRGAAATDESTDAFDTIDWLVKHVPQNNGRVGLVGISYPGFYAACALVGAHPALKAVSPQAPIADWFIGDDFHHNGALLLSPAFNFLYFFGQPRRQPTRKHAQIFEHDTPDGYDFFLRLGPLANIDGRYFKGKVAFWKEMVRHGTYDAYWQARELTQHLRGVRPAVMTVGGWFDAEDLYGTLKVHGAIERSGPRGQNLLVMGPWAHGGWSRADGEKLGNVSFGAKTSFFFREQVELPFFEHHLKGRKPHRLAKATVFETGTNIWRSHNVWPPRAAERELCLAPGARLSLGGSTGAAGFDEYISDPAKPVPYTSYPVMRMPAEHMTDDQRFATSRTDVLAYESEVLREDMTLAGPIAVRLFVSTTGTDADFVVKLVDVYGGDYPDPRPNPRGVRMGGYQQLVRGDVVRAKFRSSLSKPEPLTPGKLTRLELLLLDVYHTFRRGHRVMVHVQSSWFPLVDRNPQTFVDIYSAKPSDFRRATHRVYRGKATPSCLRVRVLPPWLVDPARNRSE